MVTLTAWSIAAKSSGQGREMVQAPILTGRLLTLHKPFLNLLSQGGLT
jgi:hypothetical protein